MKTEQILMCVVALILGMLLANMLKNVCGCKVVEGQCSGEYTNTRIFSLILDNPNTPCLQCIGSNPSIWESKWPACGGSTEGRLTDEQVDATLASVAAAQVQATERTGAVFDFDNNAQPET